MNAVTAISHLIELLRREEEEEEEEEEKEGVVRERGEGETP